jgi:3-hydroxy acid dehydrogenase / malonic semialdehyde reductase
LHNPHPQLHYFCFMSKTILITGATSGIGKACAEKFAAEGWKLIITGRRNERLQQIKDNLNKQFGTAVLTLCFDVQDRAAVFAAVDAIPGEWRQVHVLLNNSGLALGRDYFDEADINDWDTMLNTNVHGLVYISRAVLPLMIEKGQGHIINIGSTAGREVYEKGNMYCATKHAVDAISKAMRTDLLRHNIRVTALHPGAAETEFSLVRFKGDAGKAAAVYDGFTPLQAEDIAGTVFYCANLPAHVCINELVITCTQQANSFYLNKKS